jgi:hypothetical protein
MTRYERQAIWQKRITDFRSSGEKNVSTWCAQQNISVNSMYHWLKKEWQPGDSVATSPKWVPVKVLEQEVTTSSPITVRIGAVTIEVNQGFSPKLLGEVLELIQTHVK